MSTVPSKTRYFNVLVVDRSPLIQQGFKALLNFKNTRHSFRVKLADNEMQAHNLLFSNDFDIIMQEFRTPEEEFLKWIYKVQETQPGVGILIMTTMPLPGLERRLLHLRRVSIQNKHASLDQLISAIQEVSSGISDSNQTFPKPLTNGPFEPHFPGSPRPKVSPRELDILKLVYLEKTNKEIATDLCISERTVETHRKNLMRKFQVKGAAGLIRIGYALNLLH